MSDPRRWLEANDELDPLERQALSAGRDVAPPASLQGDVWRALAADFPAPDGPGADVAAPLAAVPGASALSLLQATAIGAVAGTLFMGVVTLARPSAPASVSPAPSVAISATLPRATEVPAPTAASAPPPARVEPAPGSSTPRGVEAPSAPPTAGSIAPSSPLGSSAAFPVEVDDASVGAGSGDFAAQLRAESQVVASAREALRRGDVELAFSRLGDAERRFPGGILNQERETLLIEALMRAGRVDAARQRAAAFLVAHPKSAHAARVRAITALE